MWPSPETLRAIVNREDDLQTKILECFPPEFVVRHGIVPQAFHVNDTENGPVLCSITIVSDCDEDRKGIVAAETEEQLRRKGFADVRVRVSLDCDARFRTYVDRCRSEIERKRQKIDECFRRGEHVTGESLPREDHRALAGSLQKSRRNDAGNPPFAGGA